MDFHILRIRQREHLDEPHRVFGEKAVVRQCKATAIQNETVELLGRAPQPGQARQREASPLGRMGIIKMREEHAGQVAHDLRVQEVMLHEAFDRRATGAVIIPHPRRDLALDVKGQPLLRALGNQMQMAAHRPEKILRLLELAQLARRQQPLVDELRHGGHTVEIFADPEERVQVPQAAFAFLEVRLHDVAAVAHALVALIPLGELFGDEGARGARHDLGGKAGRGFLIQPLIAPDVAPFQERRADRQILLCHADHLVERPAGMPDLQAEIPQRVEHRFDDLLRPARLLVGRQKRDIDVGLRRHLATAIAPHSEERDTLRRGRVVERIEALEREIIDQAQHLIGKKGIAGGCFPPLAGPRLQPPRNNVAPGLQRRLEQRHRRRTQLCRVRALQRHQRVGQRPPLNNGAPLRHEIK